MMPQTFETTLTAQSISPALQRMLHALGKRRFFKLIGGGSLTESTQLASVAKAYAMAGVECIDLSPNLAVIEAVTAAIRDLLTPLPVLMVSLPLDPDPHFRKIDLKEADCIQCGACLPACPTEAITLPEMLEISQALCYGCGRCVPTCPTDALILHPFQVEAQLADVLVHPQVEAVEIHSHYMDSYMLKNLFQQWGSLLTDKLISLCFRPGTLPPAQIIEFYQTAQKACSLPVILQVDGAPMSGNDDPEASRPALEAAIQVAAMFEEVGLSIPIITISGGMNRRTATLLQEPRYTFIAGIGMGTVARKAVWNLAPEQAEQTAQQIRASFSRS